MGKTGDIRRVSQDWSCKTVPESSRHGGVQHKMAFLAWKEKQIGQSVGFRIGARRERGSIRDVVVLGNETNRTGPTAKMAHNAAEE